jgi:hypothetical protein
MRRERKGNMNEDDPRDHRELNLRVDNYLVTEVVAVPPDFDIKNYLSMREQVGMFKADKVDQKQLEIISMGVTCSSIFSSMNNALINPYSVGYFLYILDEIGLIIKSHHNSIRKSYSGKSYLEFCTHWQDENYNYVRGQEVKRLSFVIVNIVQLLQKDIIKEAKKALAEVVKYQTESKEKMEEIIHE